MSAATTTPTPANAGVGSNRSLLRKIAAGTSITAILAATAIAVWPASETDNAYADGQQFGTAVAQLQSADTTEQVDTALTEIDAAVTDTRDHAGDAVADQAAAQDDALARAADGFIGTHSTDDAFEQDLYQAELDTAVDDLTSQAENFRTHGPEVQQAFWDGFDTGLNGA
jgi:hypothetical protein